MTAASCKKNCVQNILIWLSGRAVKTQLLKSEYFTKDFASLIDVLLKFELCKGEI